MKTFSIDSVLLLFSISLSLLLINVSTPKAAYKVPRYKANPFVNESFQNGLQGFSEGIQGFKKALQINHSSKKQVLDAYQGFRNSFKEVGFWLEYLDKEAYDRTINGAPLLKLEQKVSDLKVLEPKGIQVIDELMADPTIENLSEVNKQLQKLEKNYQNLAHFLSSKHLSNRQFFEASRQALVRIASLGITGFDTPGTQRGIQDSYEVLKTLERYFRYYQKELDNTQGQSLYKNTMALFQKGKLQTKNANFDTFNRLTFLKEVVNPLYKNILHIHKSLGYETIEEVTQYLPAVNYEAENIFAKDFLDAFYYVSLEKDSLYNKKKSLGKLLFYDPILSRNNEMSCATCHAPEKAFTDGLPKSLSNKGQPINRNALTLNYSVYATSFFHDLRAKRLEDQFEHVVLSTDEFNTHYQEIVKKLASSPTYEQLFEGAFPKAGGTIKNYMVDYVLAAYVMALNSFDSPIDNYFAQENAMLSEEVKKGFNLFTGKANCASCHFLPNFSGTVPPLFNESEAEILGVPISANDTLTVDPDLGRLANGMTQEIADFYGHAFKTPTVRNIAKTGPYMHNGVYQTLEEVMDFYNKGGGVGMGMNLPHQTLSADSLQLTEEEIAQIIAFMEALTDETVFQKPNPEEFPMDFENEMWNDRSLK